jgi:hypothetical protein
MRANFLDPSVHDREEALNTSAGQVGQRDVGPLEVVLGVKPRDADGVQLRGQLCLTFFAVGLREAIVGDAALFGNRVFVRRYHAP